MSYYESKTTGEKEYVFGRGGGEKLADELEAELLGKLPLGQPDWNDEEFAPSIYTEDHPTGEIFAEMAEENHPNRREIMRQEAVPREGDGLFSACIWSGLKSLGWLRLT